MIYYNAIIIEWSAECFNIENNYQKENNEQFYEQSRSSIRIGIYNIKVNRNNKRNFNYWENLGILNTEEINQHIESYQYW